MKSIKHIAAVLAVFISVLVCFDDSVASIINVYSVEIPLQTDCSGTSHHRHFSIADHFFQNNFILLSDFNQPTDLLSNAKVQFKISYFLSSIWQPPKKTC